VCKQFLLVGGRELAPKTRCEERSEGVEAGDSLPKIWEVKVDSSTTDHHDWPRKGRRISRVFPRKDTGPQRKDALPRDLGDHINLGMENWSLLKNSGKET